MTHTQEAFARAVAAGRSLSDALRSARPNSQKWKPATVHKRASEMAARPEVAEMIERLRAEAEDAAVMDCREARAMLTARARELFKAGAPVLQLCRALDALARLSGWTAAARYDAAAGVREDERPLDPRLLTDAELARLARAQVGLDAEDAEIVTPPALSPADGAGDSTEGADA